MKKNMINKIIVDKKRIIEKETDFCKKVVAFFVYKNSNSNIKSKLTQKKIQKLTYYTFAFYYADQNNENSHFNNVPLKFEAWVHGPVNEIMYNILKKFEYNPITITDITNFGDIKSFELYFQEFELNFLNDVWDLFKDWTADELEVLTHNEKPWLEQRKGLGEFEASKNIIKPKTMKEFYREKYNFE